MDKKIDLTDMFKITLQRVIPDIFVIKAKAWTWYFLIANLQKF